MRTSPYASIFPDFSLADFAGLKEHIAAHGLLMPIIVHEGSILDGRHRYRACLELEIEPRFEEYTGTDPLGFVLAANLHRRHLKTSERAMVAARIATLSEGRPKETAPMGAVSQPDAAKQLNVSRRSVQRAAEVLAKGTPELVGAVERGEVPVRAAAEIAGLEPPAQAAVLATQKKDRVVAVRVAKAEQAAREAAATDFALKPTASGQESTESLITLGSWQKRSEESRAQVLAAVASKDKFNEQDTANIEWAQWSWNPVTGCKHDCPYCYARDIANRFYPQGFEPSILPSRLSAPANTAVPARAKADVAFRNVFTCSMADLFGQWVPREWIEAVLSAVAAAPQWNFLCLTKFPQRMAEFEIPENAWMGTTVDAQARVDNAERAFENVKCGVRWLSCEPLLEPLRFKRLDLFQWIVIGGSSRSTKTPEWIPPLDWLVDLHAQARTAGCRIYYKTNSDLPESLRLREFPWGEAPKGHALPKAFRYLKGM